ncbi:MAG: hypothetical protein M1835_000128 [Candelina submexicana]|nr:MAG: hypothetical protein M1835_000128 [Candelina submexicana]
MSANEDIELQQNGDRASEASWLSDDASPLSPSPAPAQTTDEGSQKPKQKRKRRKYHGTANVWTDDEVQKLLRRRFSGESWDATIAAFPNRTRDAVVKRYSTMKCEGKNLTPRKFTSSNDTSEGEEFGVKEHAVKKRRVRGADSPIANRVGEHCGDKDIDGFITVNGAKPPKRHTNISRNDESQPALQVGPSPSAAWTSVNRVEQPFKKSILTQEETPRLPESHQRPAYVKPERTFSKTQWKAVRDRGELTGEQHSKPNSAAIPPSPSTTDSPITQSSSNDIPRLSNADHPKAQSMKTNRTLSNASVNRSPTIIDNEMQPLTEAELSHRVISRRVEQVLLSELSKSESVRGSREADLEKTVQELKGRVASLESNEVKQADMLKLQREEYKNVIRGMDEKILVVDQEKKDVELDKLDLLDKLIEAEERAKIAEEKITGWDQGLRQSAMNTIQVAEEREGYMARIQKLEQTVDTKVEMIKDNAQRFEEISLRYDRLHKKLQTWQFGYERLNESRKVVERHQIKMADVRKELDGDLSDFTGKMIKGLEHCFKEELAETQNSFGKFNEQFDKIGNLFSGLKTELQPLDSLCCLDQASASQSPVVEEGVVEGTFA